MKQHQYKFNNLNVKVWPQGENKSRDYLVSGTGNYVIDELDDDDYEACFESVTISEVIGKNGKIPETMFAELQDDIIVALNRNEGLCKALAR